MAHTGAKNDRFSDLGAEVGFSGIDRETDYITQLVGLWFVPVKGDQVDKRLAEYINNFPDRSRLKIMFMRESDGVYQFGSKRVTIRVDTNKINIRVDKS